MWQLSWILSLLPQWFWTLVLVAGVVGVLASWLLRMVPFVKQYALIIQVASIISLVAGVYFEGMYSNEAKWQAKIKELEEKVRIAEEQSNNKNVEIQERVVEKVKVIREKAKTQIEYVDRVISQDKEVIKYIENCPVPKAIIDEHNKATIPPEAVREINKATESKK